MISITIPVFNEEESLPRLRERLVAALSKLNRPWPMYVFGGAGLATLALGFFKRPLGFVPEVRRWYFLYSDAIAAVGDVLRLDGDRLLSDGIACRNVDENLPRVSGQADLSDQAYAEHPQQDMTLIPFARAGLQRP